MELVETQVSHQYKDSYGELISSNFKRISHTKFFASIMKLNDSNFYTVSSVIKRRGWFRSPLHVLLLDCDGAPEMLGAVSFLKHMNLNSALIQSSPGHYWIVVDKIGEFWQLYSDACSIPGVDKNYLRAVGRIGRFSLRMMPIKGSMAKFEGSENLKNPLVKNWYDDFEKLWQHQNVKQRYHANIINGKIGTGEILDDLANPGFQL